MPRITIDVDADLHTKLKIRIAQDGKSLQEIGAQLLADYVSTEGSPSITPSSKTVPSKSSESVPVKLSRGGRPIIDLSDVEDEPVTNPKKSNEQVENPLPSWAGVPMPPEPEPVISWLDGVGDTPSPSTALDVLEDMFKNK